VLEKWWTKHTKLKEKKRGGETYPDHALDPLG
jgi:hypothetical protein